MHESNILPTAGSLRHRTVTAFLLGSLVIAAILWLPTPAFALLMTLIVLLAAWEWCALAGIEFRSGRAAYLAVVAAGMGLFWLQPGWQLWLFAIASVWWIIQTLLLLRVTEIKPVTGLEPWLLPVGLLVLVAPWAALIHLHGLPGIGPGLVLFLMALIWTTDSLAYFVGRRWGCVKLAPAISPGKTRIGVYGGMAGAAVCGLLFAWIQSFGVADTILVWVICGLSAMISVVGDLYESLLKRRRGVKDSGQILPGHGGMLDRIDSLTAAAPLFALGLTWIL